MLGLLAALLTVTAAYSIGHFADKIIFRLGTQRALLENTVYRMAAGTGILACVILLLGILLINRNCIPL